MKDDFLGNQNPLHPARQHYRIVPNDNTNLPTRPIAILCVATGDLAYRMWDPVNAAWLNQTLAMTVGQILEIQPRRVLLTGTTGTFNALLWGDEEEEA